MNLIQLLDTSTTRPLPSWSGTWARIWLSPSIFSKQSFIVGCAVLDDRGVVDYRFITAADKFEEVYDPGVRMLVEQLIAEARQCFSKGREKHLPISADMLPAGFRIEPSGFAAGASSEAVLEDILGEAEIPMEPKAETLKATKFRSRPVEEVTEAVISAVKKRAGLKAEAILREDYFGSEEHTARVNLVLPERAGIIASGWYASADRVQLELLRAVTTVEGYSASHRKNGPPAVFFLRPTKETGLRLDQSLAIETALDKVDWQLREKGVRVATRDDEEELAEDIVEWADI